MSAESNPDSQGRRVVLAVALLPALLIVILGCQKVSGPAEPDPDATRARNVFGGPVVDGPTLIVTNEYIDPVVSTSPEGPVEVMDIPAGVPLVFCWTASSEGAEITAYRYGGDILDLNDPDQWETDWVPFDGSEACGPSRAFFFGTHTFHVEVRDSRDRRTRAGFRINIFPGLPSVDIMPGTCKNPLSPAMRGVIPAAIPGTQGIDVRDIDPASVYLWIDGQRIAPLRTRIGDIATPVINREPCECQHGGADGIDDLLMQFPAEQVIDAMGFVSRGDVIEMGIGGLISRKLDFFLVDCVTIVGPMREAPPLQMRDEVLVTLERAYNEKNFEDVALLFDEDFTFFFSPADISKGNVPVSQWDRASELEATRHLFGSVLGLAERNAAVAKRFTHQSGSVEESTWGNIKALFYGGPPDDGEISIDLELRYLPGENNWTIWIPDPSEYPGETWYERTVDYFLTVSFGDWTLTTGGLVRASFVVRYAEVGDESFWRIVQWRDDL